MLSRVADSLYWMNRYIERAEHTARLIAVKLESMIEQTREDADASWLRAAAALSAEGTAPHADAFAITQSHAFDRVNPSSMLSSLRICSFQRRISCRMALTALSETAGLKLMKYFPFRFFDLRGRNV